MKKFFYLGATLFLMASCGGSETSKQDVTDDSTSYYDCSPDQIDQVVQDEKYEGSGNEADADENAKTVPSSESEMIEEDESSESSVKEKAKDIYEKGKEKVKEIDEATKDEREELKEKGKEAYEKGKEKGKEAYEKGKENMKDLFD